eukprot:GHRR01015245.1.p1 GENE.GHRR01015245.1~~GHRR01015245.1.p1  ORF type:complete len:458 (+),score=121.45 GHRR01015245.1:224-1597(+)
MVQPEQQLKEQQLKAKYASELHNIKTGLQTLKRKFYDRQNARAKLTDAQGQLASLGQIVDWSRQPVVDALKELQQIAATELLDPTSTLPITADALRKKILASSQAARFKHCLAHLPPPAVKRLVASLVLQECLVTANTLDLNGSTLLIITSVDRSGLADLAGISDPLAAVNGSGFLPSAPDVKQQQRLGNQLIKRQRSDSSSDLNSLLQFKSVKERERFEKGEELLELLDRKSARQQEALMKYQTGGAAVREHCPYLTKEACRNAIDSQYACPRLHQKKILYPWTDESLGNCSFLDTCRDVRRCKFIHYELDPEPDLLDSAAGEGGLMPLAVPNYLKALPSPQWIKCDIRTFDWSILGKFGVIMTDPPWEIHQDLPYGTMSDQELLGMGIKDLQDDGVIFMWVTGECDWNVCLQQMRVQLAYIKHRRDRWQWHTLFSQVMVSCTSCFIQCWMPVTLR